MRNRKYVFVITGAILLISLMFLKLFSLNYVYAMEETGEVDEVQIQVKAASDALQEILKDHTVMALIYLSDMYSVRSTPSKESSVVVDVPSGQQVSILDVALNSDYEVWERVVLYYQEEEYIGYVQRENLACSDELFLGWEDTYGMNPMAYMPMAIDNEDGVVYPDIEQFPESYRAALKELKEKHPTWTFVKMNTNLEWNVVVQNELVAYRNLIPTSYPECMREEVHSPGWSQVSEPALKYYLDPRNGLSEEVIFQFEQLTYNESYHTVDAVQKFLDSTFMAGLMPGMDSTYANEFWQVGSNLGVSPFHLAARVKQEQGAGNSPLISGTYPNFEGFYNYFNIKASGKTKEEIYVNGLTYAKEKNWNSVALSIEGGAEIISANYIRAGQDTLYLQKFDVDNTKNGLFYHQYMQNICAPSSEGKNIRKLYMDAGSLENTFVFKIPVYINMPETACEKPTVSYTVYLTPPEGYSDTTIYLDGIGYPTVNRNGKLYVEVGGPNAETAVMYQYNESGVPVGMYVWELSHNGVAYQVTPLPQLQDLLTYHGFSIRISGISGIRFKTGISTELRSRLVSEGVDGYFLKEYGTLIMDNAKKDQYPMIKGGEKVKSGLAYGINDDGTPVDAIYEIIDERYRYTAVLIGLPAEQYKTEFAFRGYIILKKNEQELTVYGPPMARSIYYLAQRFLDQGLYEDGSSADLFLKQIVGDADAVTELEQQSEEVTDSEQQSEEVTGSEQQAEEIPSQSEG